MSGGMDEEISAIARRMKGEMVISISEEALDAVDTVYEFAVAAKVSGGEALGKEGFAALLKKLWKLPDDTEYKAVADDVLVVIFKKKEERDRVLRSGPWICNDWAILVDEWRPDKVVSEVSLSTFNAWIQVHNLPLGYTVGKPLEDIAKAIGGVLLVQIPAPPKRGMVAPVKYVRMLKKVDATVPATYGFYVPRRGGDPFWVDIRYERLPRMCFRCGRWNHEEDSCREVLGEVSGRYGPWLRADYGASSPLSKDKEGSSAGVSAGSQQDASLTGDGVMKEVNPCVIWRNEYDMDSGRGVADGVFERDNFCQESGGVSKGALVIRGQGREVSDESFKYEGDRAGGCDRMEHTDGKEVDKKGKGKMGEVGLNIGAGVLTDVNVNYVEKMSFDGGGAGNFCGFNIIDVSTLKQKPRNIGSTGAEGKDGRSKKKKGNRLFGLKAEVKKFKASKSKGPTVKALEQAELDMVQRQESSENGDGLSTMLISAEAAGQPRREP